MATPVPPSTGRVPERYRPKPPTPDLYEPDDYRETFKVHEVGVDSQGPQVDGMRLDCSTTVVALRACSPRGAAANACNRATRQLARYDLISRPVAAGRLDRTDCIMALVRSLDS